MQPEEKVIISNTQIEMLRPECWSACKRDWWSSDIHVIRVPSHSLDLISLCEIESFPDTDEVPRGKISLILLKEHSNKATPNDLLLYP